MAEISFRPNFGLKNQKNVFFFLSIFCLQKNVKLGLLAEPPLTPPPLLTWAPLSGNIVVFNSNCLIDIK